ncbi:avidin/streptavidin family protein [Actinomadura gamaensis]|uniref:Avidin/streptavidin family protein n=1 Tax=Actinomadura gamaensis TaxID=1763541 RepID=A0ABV9UC96_9ACTN
MLHPEHLRDAGQLERRLRRHRERDDPMRSHAGRIILIRDNPATPPVAPSPRNLGGMTDTTWIGRWRNQYGSVLTVTDDNDGTLTGTFRTALDDSAFAGAEVPVTGVHRGACVTFAFTRAGADGDSIASFTGLLRDGRLETVWHVVQDSAVKPPRPGHPAERITLPWAHAVLTNADTFTREP